MRADEQHFVLLTGVGSVVGTDAHDEYSTFSQFVISSTCHVRILIFMEISSNCEVHNCVYTLYIITKNHHVISRISLRGL